MVNLDRILNSLEIRNNNVEITLAKHNVYSAKGMLILPLILINKHTGASIAYTIKYDITRQKPVISSDELLQLRQMVSGKATFETPYNSEVENYVHQEIIKGRILKSYPVLRYLYSLEDIGGLNSCTLTRLEEDTYCIKFAKSSLLPQAYPPILITLKMRISPSKSVDIEVLIEHDTRYFTTTYCYEKVKASELKEELEKVTPREIDERNIRIRSFVVDESVKQLVERYTAKDSVGTCYKLRQDIKAKNMETVILAPVSADEVHVVDLNGIEDMRISKSELMQLVCKYQKYMRSNDIEKSIYIGDYIGLKQLVTMYRVEPIKVRSEVYIVEYKSDSKEHELAYVQSINVRGEGFITGITPSVTYVTLNSEGVPSRIQETHLASVDEVSRIKLSHFNIIFDNNLDTTKIKEALKNISLD